MSDLPELPPPVEPAWRERVTAVAGALGVEPRRMLAITATVLALVVVAVALGVRMLRDSGPPPEFTLPRADATGDASAPARSGAPVYVHVAGAVVRPGVYRLPHGARVADAIDAAGGPGPDAEVHRLNLAAKVADGERLYVPRAGESAPAPDGSVAPAGEAGSATTQDALIDLNTATAAQLEALPGVGPAIAKAIIDHRTKRRFRSVDDLLEVRGIGEAKLEQIRPHVRVA